MISLAGLRYRNVLSEFGGPVERIEAGHFNVRGRRTILANATLNPGLIRKERLCLFSEAHGTGVAPIASVARHKAVSEALERWAFHSMVRSEWAEQLGFKLDPSTTGMSAFPGLLRRQARRSAVLEAIERFSLV